MTDHDHGKPDDIDQALRSLPSTDVDPSRRERIRSSAHRTLERGGASALALLWNRIFEPALVLGVSVLYLVWAFQRAAAVLLGG
jgi:hypothetical protein